MNKETEGVAAGSAAGAAAEEWAEAAPGPRPRRRYDERVLAAHYYANEFNGQSNRRIRPRPCSLLKRRSIAKPVRSHDSNKSDNSTPEPDSAAAQWQQDQLVVTTQTRRGSTTRSYELSPDGKQLYVTTRIENQRLSQPVVIRFVYDPAKPSE